MIKKPTISPISFAALLCAALFETSGAMALEQPVMPPGLPLSGGGAIAPAYAGAGALSKAFSTQAPSAIGSFSHAFGYGTTVPELGQLQLYANTPNGTNVFAITNANINAFAAITFRGPDNLYTNNTTLFEHMAVGWNPLGSYNFIETSRFDGNGNRLLPPAEFRIQESGGIDPTGGIVYTCSTTSGSPNITCSGSGAANGNLATSASGVLPPATTVSSGGGTTNLVLSANATATSASTPLQFTNPVYNQYSTMRVVSNGPWYFNSWNGSPVLTLNRANAGSVGIGSLLSQGSPAATLEIGGTTQFDAAATQTNVYAEACNDYSAPTTGTTYTLPSGKCGAILEPAGTLATLTIKLPSNPIPGQVAWFSTTQQITALTVSPNTGQVIRGGTTPATLAAGGSFAMTYNANTVWYPRSH